MNDWISTLFQLENIIFNQPMWLWGILLWPLFWGTRTLLNRFLSGFLSKTPDDLAQINTQATLRVRHPLIDQMHQDTHALPRVKHPFSLSRLGLNLLRGIIIISLAIALAQPEKVQERPPEPQQKTVRDIVFIIESSASLLLPDYQINGQPESRMNVVKKVLDQFIGGLEGNRFGLIIYADHAYTLMPLTDDQMAARLYLNRLKPHLAGRLDSAMGEALGLALKQTESELNSETNTNNPPPLKRVIVLISDGLSQPSQRPLSDAILYAQQMQVPIYTVGIGASTHSADKRQHTGLLYQPLESQSLKTLAKATQAQYFQVSSGDGLNQVLQKISETEGVPLETPPAKADYTALYHLPLSIAVLTLLAYLLFSLMFALTRTEKT